MNSGNSYNFHQNCYFCPAAGSWPWVVPGVNVITQIVFLNFSAAGRCELKIFDGNERSKYSNWVFNNSQVTISDCSIKVYF